jgi:hypothetical protein
MEYHSDRFQDFSLVFYDKEKLLAVLPANLKDGILISHEGLTFGGVVADGEMKMPLMLDLFEKLKIFLKAINISRVIYKAIPHIYHRIPSEEDLYALFLHEARLVRRDISSAINLEDKLPFREIRRRQVSQAKRSGLEVRHVTDYETFRALLAENLRKKYGKQPVHTAAEMRLLAEKFPENIKLFAAFRSGDMLGGVLVYESRTVAHAQYIAASDEGKELGALDLILSVLIEMYSSSKKYFDFGISSEKNGRYLNIGLIQNKESFGARAIAYDFYEWEL